MKVYVKIKDQENILADLKRAEELLKEATKLLRRFDGFSGELVTEIVPAQEENGQAQVLKALSDIE